VCVVCRLTAGRGGRGETAFGLDARTDRRVADLHKRRTARRLHRPYVIVENQHNDKNKNIKGNILKANNQEKTTTKKQKTAK
jgi:hypothetical protein